MDPERIFPDEYVPNAEGAAYHPKWQKANPGEAAKWASFRDAVLAYRKDDPAVAVPAMATKYGRALVAAGEEHLTIMSVIDIGSAPITDEPAVIAGQGYNLAFEDDFTTLDTGIWREQVWWLPESAANFAVSNSILRITTNAGDSQDQYSLMTRNQAWQYGYFEARMRWSRSTANFPAFWMLSDNWIRTGNCTTYKISEYDIFEGFPNLENPTTFRSHSGTIHRNTNAGCGMADEFRDNWTTDCGFELAENWRTYSGLWTPTTASVYVEGVKLKEWPVYDTTNQPMRMFFKSHRRSATTVWTEVDWFRVWQQ